MQTCKAMMSAVVAFAISLFLGMGIASAQSNAILAGIVSSDRDGPMEGVLVSAKKQGSTITVTVVSNDKGEYAFSAGRLEPGQYQISIRASGYALDGAGTATIAAGQPAKADLKLKPVPVATAELTNTEWLTSAPGPDELKRGLLNCTDCHSVQRIFESKHTSQEFMAVFERI